MGSEIEGQKQGGIRDHNPRDRDQRCFSLDQGSGFWINKILRDKGSKFSSLLEPGIKNLGKITGSAMKKYTSLRSCYLFVQWTSDPGWTILLCWLDHFTGFSKIIRLDFYWNRYLYLLALLSVNLKLIHLVSPTPSVFISLFINYNSWRWVHCWEVASKSSPEATCLPVCWLINFHYCSPTDQIGLVMSSDVFSTKPNQASKSSFDCTLSILRNGVLWNFFPQIMHPCFDLSTLSRLQ